MMGDNDGNRQGNGHEPMEEIEVKLHDELHALSNLLGALVEKFGGMGKEIVVTQADLYATQNRQYDVREEKDKMGRTIYRVRRTEKEEEE